MIRTLAVACSAVILLGCADQERNGDAAAVTSSQNINVPTFDQDSAYALLERQVAFGPRVPGTKPHADQLAWMTSYLRERADTVILQGIAHETTSGGTVNMTNVFARFNPENDKRVLFLAHWDTRKTADHDIDPANRNTPIPGANDGASGVAVLMILADMFAKQRPEIGVDLLFTDGEDWEPGDMYIGAEHFARTMKNYRPLYGVLIDMVGDRNPVFPVEGYSQQFAPEVVERVWSAAAQLGLGNYFPRRPGIPLGDDHVPLNEAGIRTIDIIDFEYGPPVETGGGAYWHTLQDDVQNTSPVGLGVVGKLLAWLAYSGG